MKFGLGKILFILIVSVIAVSIYGLNRGSKNSNLVPQSQCACKSSPANQNNVGLMYNFGKFKNVCLNSCDSRPIAIDDDANLDFEDKSIFENKRIIKVKNILHNNRFWNVSIPVESITKTQIVFENFVWKVNHVALKFNFKGSISLKSQNSNQILKLKDSSIVISPEAALPKNKKYSLIDGMIGNYSLILRAFTETEYTAMISRLKHKVRIFNTKLNNEQTRALLYLTLIKSSDLNHPRYQLVFNNCATTTIDLLLESKALLRSPHWDVWDVLDPFRGIPTNTQSGTLRTLEWWDLLSNEVSVEI